MNYQVSAPAAPFQLALPNFEGDLQALLSLVTDGKVAADSIAVAQITEQFACYLRDSGAIDLDIAGEFLSASARLLLLKSARLLALPVAEEDVRAPTLPLGWVERPLLARLAADLREQEGHESMTPLARPELIERRLEPRSADVLARAWRGMVCRRDGVAATVTVPSFLRLEAAVSGLIRSLKLSSQVSFRRVVRGANRRDAVVHFLALLELVRRRQATATQNGLFEDITVEYGTYAAGESAARAG